MLASPDRTPWIPVATPLSRSQARLIALALAAKDIPYRVLRSAHGFRVLVPEPQALAARAEITAMEHEISAHPPASPSSRSLPNAVFLPLLAEGVFGLITTHVLPLTTIPRSLWITAGSAKAQAIQGGEIWRAVTALTLHADGAHLIANLAAGALFVAMAARRFGAGLTWLATLLAASTANLLAAWVLGSPHDSIGFSTAVFAAVGLAAWGSERRLPTIVAIGLALLALLGMGDEDTDLAAHVAGLITGLMAGGILKRCAPLARALDTCLLGTALLLPVIAWMLALA
jgi:membrane associated rhomboid family serine protease